MAYVKRDANGGIIAASDRSGGGCDEQVDAADAGLQLFLQQVGMDDSALVESDSDLVRVLEDVVELLIGKGVILFTELPEAAQQKILARQRWRSQQPSALDLLGTD